jgi:uncharacterized protein (DUF362 family)
MKKEKRGKKKVVRKVEKKTEKKKKVVRKKKKVEKEIKIEGVEEVKFVDYEKSVPKLLDKANFDKIIKDKKRIFLKPNLIICKHFPTTTDAGFVEEIIKYIKKHNKRAEIIIAEGSGGSKTKKCFEKLGYNKLSEKYKIPLLDLNSAKTTRVKNGKFLKFSFIDYPRVLLSGFVISLPVLKEHSTARATISLKNMLGAFPAKPRRNWKVAMHKWPIEYAIHDSLVCKWPDYAICDGSIAQLEHELHGYHKQLDILLAGEPLAVDKKGVLLLGHDWKRVPHLVLADKLKNESS